MMKSLLLPALLCAAALSGCAVAPQHPALRSDALPELLPAHEFFANRESNGLYTLPPDGKKIAWIAVKGFGPALFVKTVGRDDVQAFKGMPISFRWAQDTAERNGPGRSGSERAGSPKTFWQNAPGHRAGFISC